MEAIFRATIKPAASLKSIFLKLALKAVRDWFNHAKLSDLQNPKIYVAVKNQLTLNWRSAWQIRIETEEPVY
jgi:hypothetical protein